LKYTQIKHTHYKSGICWLSLEVVTIATTCVCSECGDEDEDPELPAGDGGVG